jgi:hypothetical protein
MFVLLFCMEVSMSENYRAFGILVVSVVSVTIEYRTLRENQNSNCVIE